MLKLAKLKSKTTPDAWRLFEWFANDVAFRDLPGGLTMVFNMKHYKHKTQKDARAYDTLFLNQPRYNTTCEICGAENKLTIMRQADASQRAICAPCFAKRGRA